MKNKEELLIKQAKEGYTVCYIDQCPLHNQCLRWLVGQHVPHTASTYRCVNPLICFYYQVMVISQPLFCLQ